MDWKLELIAVPVTDVDRAKSFYVDQVGFNADHDHRVSEEMRFVQLTPPGSACSICIGEGIMDTTPGSVAGLQLVVADIEAARGELSGRGVEVSEVQEFPWGSFVFFADPDGNRWSVQAVSPRSWVPGRLQARKHRAPKRSLETVDTARPARAQTRAGGAGSAGSGVRRRLGATIAIASQMATGT